jgi:ABC-type amino acid transport substrate-binding protein
MFGKQIKKVLASSVLALALGAAVSGASAETLRVEIDTSGLGNSGWIDLLFNPSGTNSALATVKLYDFTGFDASAPAQVDGGVTGSLASGFTLNNLNQGSDLFHAVNFGGKVGFSIDFAGEVGSAINRSLSTLAVALYGADQSTPLGNGNAVTGSLADLYWLSPTSTAAGSVSTRVFDSIASVGPADQISPVPEPAAWLTMGAGLGMLALVRRRQQRSATFAPA